MLGRIVKMSTEVATKRLKTSAPLIATHNGHFHADEALAVYMLRLLPEYTSSPLVRTRDPALLETCHTVVDVGGIYDDTKHRYDHHQRTFSTTFPSHQTKLSSAGLVYMHFGKAIIAQHAKLPIDHPDVNLLYEKLYDDFIEAVDAHDNGISKYDADQISSAGIEKRFKDGGVTLASLVADMNHEDPLALDESPEKPADQPPQFEEDHRFSQASTLMGHAFLRKLHGAVTAWLPARSIVKRAFEIRTQAHPSGQILILPRAGIPWKEHLYNLEESSSSSSSSSSLVASAAAPTNNTTNTNTHTHTYNHQEVLYVLYPETENDPNSKWRIQAVSKDAGSFESRKPLPEKWRGVRDAELDAVLGDGVEDGAVFVHASGFIGGHKTEAGARKMATLALEME